MAAAAWLLAPTPAHASSVDGLSLGGGIGRYDVRINSGTAFKNTITGYSTNNTAYQFFAEYRFAPFLALEGQYMNLGANRRTVAPGSVYTTKVYGWTPWLVGTVPLGPSVGVIGPFELFAKAGEYFYQYHQDLSTPVGDFFSSSSTHHHFVYGGGLGLVFVRRLDVRLEYDVLKIQNTSNSNALWLTAAINF